MKYGFIADMDTFDASNDCVRVSVDFMVDRSVLYEFMDCLKPINRNAPREPIEAILEHSCVKVVDA